MENQSDVVAVINEIQKMPPHYLKRWGRFLYSSVNTIARGDIYLLGLNPAGESSNQEDYFERDIANLPTRKINAFTDEAWARGRPYKIGCYPLQLRVKWLLTELVGDVASVCASNLVFFGSNNGTDIKKAWIDDCWRVHDKMLQIIKPRLIITFGNGTNPISPYSYLRRIYSGSEEVISAGHGCWQCRGFKTTIHDMPTFIAGLPHLSRYDIIDKYHVTNWLKSKLSHNQ